MAENKNNIEELYKWKKNNNGVYSNGCNRCCMLCFMRLKCKHCCISHTIDSYITCAECKYDEE